MTKQRSDHVPNRMPPQPDECRDAVHWFVDSVGLYQGSPRGLFLSDYSEDQEALIEAAVINFKSKGVTTMVVSGEMLYRQADYLYQHAVSQSPFGRPLLSQMELDMLDADVLIVTDLVAPETPQQLWYLYHHLLYPRAISQKNLLLTTPLGYDEFLAYGADCDDVEYAGRRVTWEKTAWLLDGMFIDLHHFRMLRGENLPPMLKCEYYLYKAVVSRNMNLIPQQVLGDYIIDFALMARGNKLAVEVDLLSSLDQQNSRSVDAKRTLVMLSDGWKVLRFTAADLLANLMDCVDAVADVWVTGLKKSPSGRLVCGQAASQLIDLPVEDDVERLAITHGAGPVAITGGAGTGKSTCIVYRVAHLLAQGVNPERVLVISHSTESVRCLRSDLEKLVEKPVAQKVSFHSWNELGLKLLKENTSAIKRKPPLKVEGNPQRVIQRLLTKYKKDLDQLTLELSEELEEFTIASLISLYKANLVTPKHVKERAKSNVDELVARVYLGYEEQLQKSNKIDRDDMVTLAAQLLADNADIRARYQYQYEFVLVDEFQDATAAADLLARILALPQDNLYIAGDEDESIYESKGSLPRILSETSVRLPNARCYVLERNWRSHPTIVEVARRLLNGLQRRRIKKDMVPGWEMTDEIAVVGPQLAESESAEAEWVAVEIQNLLGAGRNPQDIAILYRYNRYASMVEEALFRKGIKCLTTNPDSTMVPDEVADVMAFLRLVMDPDGPKARESFERVCQLRSKEVDPKLFNTIASFAEANNLSFLKAVEIYSEAVADQSCQDLQQLVLIIRTMNHENLPPAETIALLKRTQRMNDYYRSVKVPPGVNYEPMRKLGQLEEEARKFKTVSEFVRAQTTPKSVDGQVEPLVYILSLHEAKGKEYPVVFLTGMAEGLFPSETANDQDEERRLCYLGMTRAKDVLYVSYPGKFNNVALAPSRFLVETMQILSQQAAYQVGVPAAQAGQAHGQPAFAQPGIVQSGITQQGLAQPATSQMPVQTPMQQQSMPPMQQQSIAPAAPAMPVAPQSFAAPGPIPSPTMHPGQAQQEAAMRAQQEAAQRAQQEAAMRAQQEAAMRAQQEAAMRAQQEAAMRAQQEAAVRAQQEAAVRAQQEAELKAQQEAAMRAQQEAAVRAQQEAELKAQQEAAMRAQQEAELRAQEEAAMRAQQEAELKAQQEAAMKAQQEAAVKAQREAALRAKQEAELRVQQEAALRAQQEAAMRVQQEAALRAQQAAAMRAQQEATQMSEQEAAIKAEQDAILRARQEEAAREQMESIQAAKQEALRAAQEEEARAAAMQRPQTSSGPMPAMQEPFGEESFAPEQVAREMPVPEALTVAGFASQSALPSEETEVTAQVETVIEAVSEEAAWEQASAPAAAPADIPATAAPVEDFQPPAPEEDKKAEPPPARGKGRGKKKTQQTQDIALEAAQAAAEPPLAAPLQAGEATALGLPPQAGAPGEQYAPPSVPIPKPSLGDPAKAFWNTVNSAMKGDARPVAGGGVPPGVTAPLPAQQATAPAQQEMQPQVPTPQPVMPQQQAIPQAVQPQMPAAQQPAGQQPLPPEAPLSQYPAAQAQMPAQSQAYGQPQAPLPAQSGQFGQFTQAAQSDQSTQAAQSEPPRTASVKPSYGAPPSQVYGQTQAQYPAVPPPQGQAPTPQPQAIVPAANVPAAPVITSAQIVPAAPQGMACPGCGEQLVAGSRFCGECGFRLETRINACHLCGAPQEGDAKFCGECGSKLHDNKPAPAVPELASAADLQSYETYLSGQKPSQAGWVTKLKKILD